LPNLVEVFEDAPHPPVQWKDADGPKSIVSFDRFSGVSSLKVAADGPQLKLLGLNLPIRENPRFGEYRYISFAWRKKGGQQIAMDLDFAPGFDGGPSRDEQVRTQQEMSGLRSKLAEQQQKADNLRKQQKQATSPKQLKKLQDLEANLESLRTQIRELEQAAGGGANQGRGAGDAMIDRYHAGTPQANAPEIHQANRTSDRVPDQWVLVTRDLFKDFGAGQLNGLTLSCPDGEYALFDHIYLARSMQDFERCPTQAPPLVIGK
jgi:hypothetical protein